MLAQPGMVRRALDCEVERDRNAELGARAQSGARTPAAVPSSGCSAVCPPVSFPIAQGLPGIGAPGRRSVVAALAMREADRVHGWEVEHVDAELRELRQELLDAYEASPRAREELVPASRTRHARHPPRPRASARPPPVPSDRPSRPRVLPRRSGPGRPEAQRPPRARSRDRPGRPPPCARARAASEATRSTHATMPNCQRPSASAVNDPCQRSTSSGIAAIGVSRQRRAPTRRNRSAPPSTSCPSRRSVAHTSTRAPSERLTGYRPPSIWGQMRSIRMRSGRRAGSVRGAPRRTRG